jgi:hypothetical protein
MDIEKLRKNKGRVPQAFRMNILRHLLSKDYDQDYPII